MLYYWTRESDLPLSLCLSLPPGEMLLHLDSLNSDLCTAVVNCSPALKSPASDSTPFGCYDYLSVYHPEEHTALMELVAAIEKGHVIVT